MQPVHLSGIEHLAAGTFSHAIKELVIGSGFQFFGVLRGDHKVAAGRTFFSSELYGGCIGVFSGRKDACVEMVAVVAFAEDIREGLSLFILDLQARSEEHTSELQSLMRISYAVFCLKKKKIKNIN